MSKLRETQSRLPNESKAEVMVYQELLKQHAQSKHTAKLVLRSSRYLGQSQERAQLCLLEVSTIFPPPFPKDNVIDSKPIGLSGSC